MNHIVEAKSVFRVSREAAFDVFADPKQMSKFWFNRRDTGLKPGESVSFFMGPGKNAPSFPVQVKEVSRPNRLVLEWGEAGDRGLIEWAFHERGPAETLVHITETGHQLQGDALLVRLLDATGGFNQVIIAAKTLAEHGVSINVVSDHA